MSPTYLGNATTEYGAVDSEIFFQSRRARSVVIIYPVLRFHRRAGDNEMKMAKDMQARFRAIVDAGAGTYSTEVSRYSTSNVSRP